MDEGLTKKLEELGLTAEHITKLGAEGAASETDLASLNADEIKTVTGCGLVIAKKVAAAFVPAPPAAPPVEGPTAYDQPSMDILPPVPDDGSFLEMLKVGGVLKIQPVDVISAMRAAIAQQAGLYELPDILMERMESFADEQEEPVGESFYVLQKMLTTRAYGDILSVIGVTGNFVSERRKKDVLKRLNDRLWPALRGFQVLLTDWVAAWNQGANPAMALQMFMLNQMGGPGAIMPPGMMAPPDTAGLRDEAEAVINRINGVFAGTGIPVARALAFDATRIKNILEEPALPAAVGATTKDQMLKSLGINVGADYVRLERNVIRYALAIMELPKVASGREEYAYLAAMLTLGATIPWDKLDSDTPVNGGRRAAGRREEGVPATAGAGFPGKR